MTNWQMVLSITQGILSIIIAIVTVYIAWQQWRINKEKLALDKYERRLRIYEKVTDVLVVILRQADISYEDIGRFKTSVSEADFLFGQEIIDFIESIHKRGINLHFLKISYRAEGEARPEGYNHEEITKGSLEEILWFNDAYKDAKGKFKKYLSISAI